MLIYNGQMMFHAGENRNITFAVDKASGATITFGDLDLQTLPTLGNIQEYRQQMRVYESRQNASQTIVAALWQGQAQIQRTLSDAQAQVIVTGNLNRS